MEVNEIFVVPPRLIGFGETDKPVTTATLAKFAVIVVFEVRVTLQLPVPEQPPPLHPENVEFPSGVAVRETVVP